MRVGLTGLGSIGRRHAANLLALGCEVVAMDVSREARETAAALLPTVQVSDALNFAGLDALVIATPAESHLQWVEEAIRRQIPFFVEKPLGTLEQIEQWRGVVVRAPVACQVGYNLRFHSDMEAIRAFVPSPEDGGFFCDWNMQGRTYTSPLLETSHELDLALWCGAPSDVARVYVSDDATAGDVWLGADERWQFSFDANDVRYYRHWSLGGGGRDIMRRFFSPSQLGDESYRRELEHFTACARSGEQTICPLADGLRVLEVCARIEQMTKAVA